MEAGGGEKEGRKKIEEDERKVERQREVEGGGREVMKEKIDEKA